MALWRVEQAAEYLGIRPKTLYEWVRSGRVPHRKIGFNVRFDPDELREWTESKAQGATSSAEAAGSSGVLTDLAIEASRTLRRLEKHVGASLSFTQRQELTDLADRLEAASRDTAP